MSGARARCAGRSASVKGRRAGPTGRPGRPSRRRPQSALDAERLPQHQRRLALGALRHGRRRHQRGAVEGAGELVQLHRDTRLQQALGVGDPLVTQRVVLRRRDVGRRQPREIRCPGRRGVRRHVGRAVERTEIRPPALLGQRPVPHGRVHEGLHGAGLQPIVELGDLQELEADRWAASVAGQQGRRRREPTPGARPGQRHPIGVDAQRVGLGVQVRQRGVTVVQAGRIGVLGRQAVVDRHHHGAGGHGHLRRAGMLGLDAADHEATAVDHHDAGHPRPPPAWPLRAVHAHGHVRVALVAGHHAVVDVERLDPGDVERDGDEDLFEGPARRHRVGQVHLGQQVDHGRQLRVDHDRSSPVVRNAPGTIWAASGCRRRCGSTRR